MALPKHNNPSDKDRVAVAPYNFVPLPDDVIVQPEADIPPHDAYYNSWPLPTTSAGQLAQERLTGHIVCELTTASPLYVRAAMPLELFIRYGNELPQLEKQYKEALKAGKEAEQNAASKAILAKIVALKNQVAPFFYTHDQLTPVIPGSSLRGMLRALVEIVTYSKVQPVNQEKIFYRAVADKMTTLRESYQNQMEDVEAGYVDQDAAGNYYIQPVPPIAGQTFFRVKEEHLKKGQVKFTWLTNDNYKPQYHFCYFKVDEANPERVFEVSPSQKPGYRAGWLICSGSMQKKRSHWIVPYTVIEGEQYPISEETIQAYLDTISVHQTQSPFDSEMGCLVKGRPIFYLRNDKHEVVEFGPTRNFRLTYRDTVDNTVLSARSFVPRHLRNPEQTDMAEGLFGYVEEEAQHRQTARAGRVFVSDATLTTDQEPTHIWYNETPMIPKILSGPKITTFPHYLTQRNPDHLERWGGKGQTRKFLNLDHYATSTRHTAIRGHKLYWHKGSTPQIELDNPDVTETQLSRIKPLQPEVTFQFTIRFENISHIELGALWWILDLGSQENYRLKLGMGKPLGMGAIKTKPTLYLTDRQARYQTLFADNQTWHLGQQSQDKASSVAEQAKQQFEAYILQLDKEALFNTGRLNQLKALLSWPGPVPEKTRYLEIEQQVNGKRKNEYSDRKVLPTPLYVLGDLPSESGQPSPAVQTPSTVPPPQKASQQKPPLPKLAAVGPTLETQEAIEAQIEDSLEKFLGPAKNSPPAEKNDRLYHGQKVVEVEVVGDWRRGRVDVKMPQGEKGVLKASRKQLLNAATENKVNAVIDSMNNDIYFLKIAD